eukprot:4378305-Prymnesium_polylepis.1
MPVKTVGEVRADGALHPAVCDQIGRKERFGSRYVLLRPPLPQRGVGQLCDERRLSAAQALQRLTESGHVGHVESLVQHGETAVMQPRCGRRV